MQSIHSMSLGWGDSLDWMAQLGKKLKRRMGWVKGASGDLAQQRSLGCWEELVGLLATQSAAVE